MNIQAQKAIIIEQFKQINDENLINAIKNMLDYGLSKEQKHFDIPEAHQKLVMERLEEYKQNLGSAMDFDSAMDDIEKEL